MMQYINNTFKYTIQLHLTQIYPYMFWFIYLLHPKQLYWNESGELLCIVTEDSFFILKYSCEAFEKSKEASELVTEDGIEDAFDVGFLSLSSSFFLVYCHRHHLLFMPVSCWYGLGGCSL